ncbi:predicted protein [Postia placenta Mad-698-R]|uniref:Uncharacterized protein n=1 Tax=Postia placenta MAD-698-R-SB12 TaxID=670580 RepID=A0A1X6N0X8_9APHY|nr:hypothetical protein POSPLADRAFT_1142436 [Postia placenta MAD-698-R-SB12]EED80403.1 predicted protein [Postia placenta Mad-698-R]OSX62116.1 hypothetical protein POSPLADRAFT_1142436 [Postia placenta MAD-698-R-SB12]
MDSAPDLPLQMLSFQPGLRSGQAKADSQNLSALFEVAVGCGYGGPGAAVSAAYVNPTKPWQTRRTEPQEHYYAIWGGQLETDGKGRIKTWDVVKPTAHIFYGTRMIDMKDDVGKWDGFEDQSPRIRLRGLEAAEYNDAIRLKSEFRS